MLPIEPKPVKPLPTSDLPQLREAVGVLFNPSPTNSKLMQASEQALQEADPKDIGDSIADLIELIIPLVPEGKARTVLAIAAKFIRLML